MRENRNEGRKITLIDDVENEWWVCKERLIPNNLICTQATDSTVISYENQILQKKKTIY